MDANVSDTKHIVVRDSVHTPYVVNRVAFTLDKHSITVVHVINFYVYLYTHDMKLYIFDQCSVTFDKHDITTRTVITRFI